MWNSAETNWSSGSSVFSSSTGWAFFASAVASAVVGTDFCSSATAPNAQPAANIAAVSVLMFIFFSFLVRRSARRRVSFAC